MGPVETFVLLVGLTVVITPLARRLRLAEPIAFVLAGAALSRVPGFPRIELAPSLVFLLVLPPLLFGQAWFTSWRDFRANIRAISLLAVGLVIFTTLAVGFALHALVPAIPLAAAMAFGAIVSPPDAVAVAAVAKQLRLPRRLVVVMEGESLVNDATGLVALRFALAALFTGSFSVPLAALELVKVAVGGVAVGLFFGWLILRITRLWHEPAWHVALSLLTPFIAYLPAERLHLSGVLAVVAAGLYLGWRLPEHLPAASQLLGRATWRMVDFILNGAVFLLIGLQLSTVLAGLKVDYSWPQLLGWAAAISGLVIVLRPLWIFPVTHTQRWLIPGLKERDPAPPWPVIATLSWAGVRGVVSLAAALALPLRLPDGRPFPERELLVFLTFAVILATLVVQGLSFPWLVRTLGLTEPQPLDVQEKEARAALAKAALAEVDRRANEGRWNEHALQSVRSLYHEHLEATHDELADTFGWSPRVERAVSARQLQRAALNAERRELLRLRRVGTVNDEILRRLGEELDVEEARLGG